METRARMKQRMAIEDAFWWQKARLKWDLKGDKNTSYFHNCVSFRHRRLHIHKVEMEDDGQVKEPGAVKTAISSYFKKVYAKVPIALDDDFLQAVPAIISENENQMLARPPDKEEILAAVGVLGTQNAPGADGFLGGFFRATWDIISDDLLDVVNIFLSGFELPKEISSTLMVLIPKVKNPSLFSDF
ncbi:uncharacterized protein M6B38_168465 [Iris pallida]|uniref:Reverse transcriptase n=1 Tax=Iris pallida TaxID=29817 RepID=A0AAX6ESZ6_IRIPA|nr:uncharacterized protein M6B38_106545 [Iris pallida]KAJ6808102.1 uncharacterized protein M6B38_168465 [Iris pallida]